MPAKAEEGNVMPRAQDERPDEKPKINANDLMSYPISILRAELQRVKHKINELETEQSKPMKVQDSGKGTPCRRSAQAVHEAFRERLSCIGALKAKIARIGEAIHMLQSVCGLEGKTSDKPYDTLLHLDVLLKHFPSLAKGATDVKVLRELELQAFQLEG